MGSEVSTTGFGPLSETRDHVLDFVFASEKELIFKATAGNNVVTAFNPQSYFKGVLEAQAERRFERRFTLDD